MKKPRAMSAGEQQALEEQLLRAQLQLAAVRAWRWCERQKLHARWPATYAELKGRITAHKIEAQELVRAALEAK